jgi:6-phosphogluconolactonase
MNIQSFLSEQNFIEESVKKIEQILQEAIHKRGKAFVALSGGKTPSPIYEKLAESSLDFSRVEFFLADERYTDLESAEANYQLLKQTIFKNYQGEIKNFHYFNTQLPIEECLRKYDEELRLVPRLQFDLIILGIGTDGHFASIFPGSALLENKAQNQNEKPEQISPKPKHEAEVENFLRNLTAHTTTDQFIVRDRLTLLPEIILRSQNLFVLLNSKDKKSVIEELQKGKKTSLEFPSKMFITHPNLVINFCCPT